MYNWLKSILLFGVTIIMLALVLEFFIFRYVLISSDLPRLAENNGGVLKFEPNQAGTYRIKSEIHAPFNINSNGWNSSYPKYNVPIQPDKTRIAVIGDSYVEALQVDYQNSSSEVLLDFLGREYFEVYRFGISGAPLSHYLYILEKEVIQYSPHMVVLNIVHNDFIESMGTLEGTYTDSFSTFRMNSVGKLVTEPPMPYKKSFVWYLKQSATFRYVYVRMKFIPRLITKAIMAKCCSKIRKDNEYKESLTHDNRIQRIKAIAHKAMAMLSTLSQIHDFIVLIVIDADRAAIVNNSGLGEAISSQEMLINRMLSDLAKQYEFLFLDLQPIVVSDYRVNGKRFNFNNDYHWNDYMHSLVGREMHKLIIEKNQ
jgi:hypothetical protein